MLKRNVISVCNHGDRASVKLNANVSMLILMFNSSEVGNKVSATTAVPLLAT